MVYVNLIDNILYIIIILLDNLKWVNLVHKLVIHILIVDIIHRQATFANHTFITPDNFVARANKIADQAYFNNNQFIP